MAHSETHAKEVDCISSKAMPQQTFSYHCLGRPVPGAVRGVEKFEYGIYPADAHTL